MDTLSAAVPMKVDLNPQLTLMASTILRTHAVCVCDDFGTAKAHATFRRLVHTGTEVEIPDTDIVVKLGHRANNPLLIAAGYATGSSPSPWLDSRCHVIRFVRSTGPAPK